MKKYKYVRLGLSGESREVDGKLLHMSTENNDPLPNDLNRLLEQGWRPVRETVVDWHYWKWFKKWHYPCVFILLEKEFGEDRITERTLDRVATGQL